MAFSNGMDQSRQNRFVTAAEATFMVPNPNATPYIRMDVGSDGNGLSTPQKWNEHLADGMNDPVGRALAGEEGLITRAFSPRYRELEIVERGVYGLPVSDTEIDTNTRRKIVWTYPKFGAPAIETVTGYYGLDGGAAELRGGKVQSYDINVTRNADGGSVSGNITYHFNWLTLRSDMPNTTPRSEVQTLEFPEDEPVSTFQALAVRKYGTVPLSAEFTIAGTASTYRAALKAAIEEIFGGTWTVTGTLTDVTDGTYGDLRRYGTLTATAGGAAANMDHPAIEIISGEYQTWDVTGGDSDADYSYGGATAKVLGQTASTIQTDVRTTGGSKALVVVKGSSTATVTGTVATVAGAGDGSINGDYTESGTSGGKKQYVRSGNNKIFWVTNRWLINDASSNSIYENTSDTLTPPSSGWVTLFGQTGPAPTISGLVGTPGSAHYAFFFPITAGNVTTQTVAGTGSVTATVQTGLSLATGVVVETTTNGSAGDGATVLNSPYLEPTQARVYIATDDDDLASIDMDDMPDELGAGGDPHLLLTCPTSSFSKADMWKAFYPLNGKLNPTDFVAGAATTQASCALPNDMSDNSDCRFLHDAQTGCSAPGFWFSRRWVCNDGYEYWEDVYVTRMDAPEFGNDNDISMKGFGLGKTYNPEGTGSERKTLILPL